MNDERAGFAQRLRKALAQHGLEESPTAIEKLLSQHTAFTVTSQAISAWLSGKHLPKQDAIRALARLFGIEPHELQYGSRKASGVREPQPPWPVEDRFAIESFASLPDDYRRLVRDVIATLEDAAARIREVERRDPSEEKGLSEHGNGPKTTENRTAPLGEESE
ncbi:MAG TPA: helix-turn-helix transcriptional regulator [Rudaea sp.]|nr:helix-turn-helix transcriptional regulator [Rudaea sp.]